MLILSEGEILHEYNERDARLKEGDLSPHIYKLHIPSVRHLNLNHI